MSKTVVRKNESLDDALRRFKRSVSKTGTLQEYRKREFYEKPSVKRKKKSEAARKRKNKRRVEFLEEAGCDEFIGFIAKRYGCSHESQGQESFEDCSNA